VVIIVLGFSFFVLGVVRLNVREINRTGLCGSIVQGSRWDDGGASTPDCNRLRHHDLVVTAALFILAVASIGLAIGHILYTRTRRRPGRPAPSR
jgi:hypothetical protein